jgi:hypothetical protein
MFYRLIASELSNTEINMSIHRFKSEIFDQKKHWQLIGWVADLRQPRASAIGHI